MPAARHPFYLVGSVAVAVFVLTVVAGCSGAATGSAAAAAGSR